MRELFDEAIGASSPTTIDIDAVIARARRSTAIRRGAAVATVVAVIAAVAGTAAAGSSLRIGLAVPPDGPSGPAAGLSPEPLPSRAPEPPVLIQARLSGTLDLRLTAALPGVRLVDRRTRQDGVRVYPIGAVPGYLASMQVLTGAGVGTLSAVFAPRTPSGAWPSTGPATGRPNPPTSCAEFWLGSVMASAYPAGRQCEMRAGLNGTVQIVAAARFRTQAIRYEVITLWADGYNDIALDNYFEGWEQAAAPPDPAYLATPQLTLDQLATLADTLDLAP